MLSATTPLLAKACTSLAQTATEIMADGAHSFASVLDSLRPTSAATATAPAAPSKAQLQQQVQQHLHTLAQLLRQHTDELGLGGSAPLTLEVDAHGAMTVQGDERTAAELKDLFAMRPDLQAALTSLAGAHAKYFTASAAPAYPGAPPFTAPPLRLSVRGGAVELLSE